MLLRPFPLFAVLVALVACDRQEEDPTPHHRLAGRYIGTQTRVDFRADTQSVSEVHIYLNRIRRDGHTLLELVLPNADRAFAYELANGQLVLYDRVPFAPMVSVRNDTLLGEWWPSQAPLRYSYRAVRAP